jgi:AraC family transcriptional regulator of adaptative response/methylated-DNA-[protein]-cysteine methyltransferase
MQRNNHFELVADTIKWVADHQAEQPDLNRLSSAMGVSPHHLQRTFQMWAGVSPKQFLKSLTRKEALARLNEGSSVLDAALESGLSGPGRLHDLLISTDALTPGQIRKRGEGISIRYGFGDSLFGQALVAWTPRGINFLGFCQEKGPERTLEHLREQWCNSRFTEDSFTAQKWLDTIFSDGHDKPIPLWLRGSAFQLKVWEALMEIPEGQHATYGHIASLVGNPGAARAVGTAIGSNPLAYVIPCHRVIRQVGDIGGYRWGESTKRAMIGYEAASVSL